MKNLWESLSDDIINKSMSKIQQYNISNEAFNDALNDNPEEVMDEIPEEPENQEETAGGSDSEFSDDSSTTDSTASDASAEMPEEDNLDIKIKKNKFADINAKIYVIELYDRLLDSVNKAREILNENPNLKSGISQNLDDLYDKIEDEKQSSVLYTKSENLVRYNLYNKLTCNLLNEIISKNKEKKHN